MSGHGGKREEKIAIMWCADWLISTCSLANSDQNVEELGFESGSQWSKNLIYFD